MFLWSLYPSTALTLLPPSLSPGLPRGRWVLGALWGRRGGLRVLYVNLRDVVGPGRLAARTGAGAPVQGGTENESCEVEMLAKV